MPPAHPDAIVAEQLSKAYGKTSALNEFSLRVPAGAVCALLGHNGAGKTTAVKILTTLRRADTGRAIVAGYDTASQAHHVRSMIGLVAQHAALDEILTGHANLTMFGRLSGLSARQARIRAGQLLEQFSLTGADRRAVATYSGGMRRRLDLAASLIIAPAVLFVDEPTTGLDPAGRRDVWQAINQLVKDGTSVLLTTQYLEEADALANQVAIIRNGTIVAEGTPSELKAAVGGSRAEFTFADHATTAQARRLAQPWASGLMSDTGIALGIPVNSDADVVRVCGAFAAHDISPETMAIRRPSLDDVFLQYHQEAA